MIWSALIVLNCTVRNGDAHLKNFAVVYDEVAGEARLAPVYDVVTTTAYLPQDTMALTLDGKPLWPTGTALRRFGSERVGIAPARVEHALAKVCMVVERARTEMQSYANEHPQFAEIASRMNKAWFDGMRELER